MFQGHPEGDMSTRGEKAPHEHNRDEQASIDGGEVLPTSEDLELKERQRRHSNAAFAQGSRSHVTSDDELVRWIVRWQMRTALRRISAVAPGLKPNSSLLFVCAGEGLEGSIACDEGFTNVTVSDLAPSGVEEALKRDERLQGQVLDAEAMDLPDRSYDVVITQNGLHHLPRPVLGFTEMIRVSRLATCFLEPHNSMVGRTFGRSWERYPDAVNYVFRWDRQLVEDVASSYLGEDAHRNHSFAFWHHNRMMHRIGERIGGGRKAIRVLNLAKTIAPDPLGNQFCGLIVRTDSSQSLTVDPSDTSGEAQP